MNSNFMQSWLLICPEEHVEGLTDDWLVCKNLLVDDNKQVIPDCQMFNIFCAGVGSSLFLYFHFSFHDCGWNTFSSVVVSPPPR